MKFYSKTPSCIEAGIDEAGRGCLLGPVVVAAVIWDATKTEGLATQIMDSKKLTPKKRRLLRKYIEDEAVDFSVALVDHEEIDSINILNATLKGMHLALDGLDRSAHLDHILVDGDKFKPYLDKRGEYVPHACIIDGDNEYISIAAASILAKVHHDEWIEQLLHAHPEYDVYNLAKNQGYGAKAHMDAIKQHGVTRFHRKSFKCCKSY